MLTFVSSIFKCTQSSHQTNEQKEDIGKPSAISASTQEDFSEKYDPYAHGKQQHPTIFWGPIFHLFKFTVGTGILSLPYAFKEVGYGVAIFSIILVGFVYIHVLHNLLEVEYELCKKLQKPNLTYAGVVHHSFEQGPPAFRGLAPIARFMVYFHFIFNKSINSALYLVTIGGNLKIIIDHYCNIDINIESVITPVMIVIISLALIRNLKFLAPLSLLTNALNLISFALILTIPLGYPGLNDLKAINDLSKFPYFFSLTVSALNCSIIVIPLKNDMKEPKKFVSFFGVLNIASSAAATLFCTFGMLGYAKFGKNVKPNILHNLSPNQPIPFIILSLFSCTISISIILTMYVALDTIWNNILEGRKMKHPKATEYALRIALCIVPFCLAITLPDFKIMVALAAVIAVLMDETVPIVLHILLLLQKKSKTMKVYLSLMKDVVLVLICLSLFSSASIDLIDSIIRFYR